MQQTLPMGHEFEPLLVMVAVNVTKLFSAWAYPRRGEGLSHEHFNMALARCLAYLTKCNPQPLAPPHITLHLPTTQSPYTTSTERKNNSTWRNFWIYPRRYSKTLSTRSTLIAPGPLGNFEAFVTLSLAKSSMTCSAISPSISLD